jgi:hypothetical protein
VLQLWEGRALCQGLRPSKAGKLTSYSSTSGQPVEEPVEGLSAAIWPCQLHYRGGEIPTGEELLAGMFFLNEHPIIILFDSRPSHNFISSACVERARLTLVASGVPYAISTPGG